MFLIAKCCWYLLGIAVITLIIYIIYQHKKYKNMTEASAKLTLSRADLQIHLDFKQRLIENYWNMLVDNWTTLNEKYPDEFPLIGIGEMSNLLNGDRKDLRLDKDLQLHAEKLVIEYQDLYSKIINKHLN